MLQLTATLRPTGARQAVAPECGHGPVHPGGWGWFGLQHSTHPSGRGPWRRHQKDGDGGSASEEERDRDSGVVNAPELKGPAPVQITT